MNHTPFQIPFQMTSSHMKTNVASDPCLSTLQESHVVLDPGVLSSRSSFTDSYLESHHHSSDRDICMFFYSLFVIFMMEKNPIPNKIFYCYSLSFLKPPVVFISYFLAMGYSSSGGNKFPWRLDCGDEWLSIF